MRRSNYFNRDRLDTLQVLRQADQGPSPVSWTESLSPYKPVSSLEKIWDNPSVTPLKLDWNESTIPPSPKVYQAIVSFLSHSNHLNWYPELSSKSLASEIADYVHLRPDNVLVTNGSDDALELVCKTYLGPEDRVVVPMPTYTHFLVHVHARGAKVVPFFSNDLFSIDEERLSETIGKDTKLVYLVSPNNPTGVTYDAEPVHRLLEAHPTTLFIVDEAYHEFYGRTVANFVPEYKNLVVTRTFSKCFGIAGLRIGYLLASDEIMSNLRKVFNPKSVNRLGQIAASACLTDRDYYARFVEEVNAAKELLRDEMAKRGMHVRITPANFVLMRVPRPKEFCRMLEDEGVYVRDRSDLPAFENYIRISVPTVAQTQDLLRRIDRVLDRMESHDS